MNFVLLNESVFYVFHKFSRADDLLERAPGGSHIGGLPTRGAHLSKKEEEQGKKGGGGMEEIVENVENLRKQ